MELKNIKEKLERALKSENLGLTYIRVDRGAIDQEDEKATYYTSIGIEPFVEPEELEKAIDEIMPAEHCQHEYDCCGNWYQGGFRVVNKYPYLITDEEGTYGSYVVMVTWARNV
tara:strand:- start:6546 stop:6887 length:342 start_codon:yes stop_codon:yes gene_type:complete